MILKNQNIIKIYVLKKTIIIRIFLLINKNFFIIISNLFSYSFLLIPYPKISF